MDATGLIAIIGWAVAAVLFYLVRVEQKGRTVEREAMRKNEDLVLGAYGEIVKQNEKLIDLYNDRTAEMIQRIATMRKEGFTRGGGAVPPERMTPAFIPEIEKALKLMPPDVSVQVRRFATELRDANVEESEIMRRIDEGEGATYMLQELMSG